MKILKMIYFIIINKLFEELLIELFSFDKEELNVLELNVLESNLFIEDANSSEFSIL
jgi:hypothetical protein